MSLTIITGGSSFCQWGGPIILRESTLASGVTRILFNFLASAMLSLVFFKHPDLTPECIHKKSEVCLEAVYFDDKNTHNYKQNDILN